MEYCCKLGLNKRVLGLGEDSKLSKMPTVNKPRIRCHFVGATHHETLQRIGVQEECNYYQQHWFSAGLEVKIIILLFKTSIDCWFL